MTGAIVICVIWGTATRRMVGGYPGYPWIPEDTTPGYPPIPPLDTPRYHALGAHSRWLGGTDCNADSAGPRARGTFRFCCVGFDNRVAARALYWGRRWAFTVQGARWSQKHQEDKRRHSENMRTALQIPRSNVGKLPSLDFIEFYFTAPRSLQQIGCLYCTWRKAVAKIGGRGAAGVRAVGDRCSDPAA
jgi:hypothetical protein